MSIKELVSVAKAGIENLRPQEVEAEMRSGNVLLVDVREPAEAASGAIPGATFTPRGTLEFCADPDSPDHVEEFMPGRRVIVYSTTGLRSALAARSLQSLGYTDVAHLEGGLTMWTAAGFALS